MVAHGPAVESSCLDLLDLFADDDRIILADLILAQLFVVELAVVFVGIAMLPAEQASASAVEASETDFSTTRFDDAPSSFLLLAACARACK